ncbi:muramoyltetrapeptide carboxypeptidase [Streptomyces sp. SAI-208]|uniref:S66 peptidase family protein n=1 Tax=unclassified Streptomyces TaxID=2593676 RepID=UPI0024753DC6|nr:MULTISPECIES: LD-carboxypeptidase [unclassified Streptomyces]MDH6515475.1 muramoyltetrapeptide carboxypeptidase [Streptomyces sp. SAI-090]MDH6547687.1 muramoyltetrapeptide carboxypeptidase [Streptomyces sp. SAI-041]MDH6588287.1 muramoyltetrapeptide carboxypeptidase [Streptomyces sp. SAI-133]MDH6606318.1 muramoyltetrapeptide carboxypeptidase [Streptomyces sp. SAI-208]MDH6620438.1 muramoyltetrapeptide carboxypeptidase [Streptomyces sp. SAI-135]
MTALVRPSRLSPGARVAVVAPSGPVVEERLQAGLDLLRGWDLDPVVAPHVLDRHGELGYLAGSDADRAADLQRAWCDPAVDAVLCARGGYGAQRMVDLLDWDAMRAAGPKVFVGFSDVTTLHQAFATRLGLVTLYGPAAAGADFVKNAVAQEQLRATLFAPETVRTLTSRGTTLVPGRARGVTLGGCLSLLATDLGTRHARTGARDGLLLIEDVGEQPYRIDRMLTHLRRSGWLDGVRGIVLGSWAGCGPYDALRAVLADRLGGLGVPVAEEFGFGHGEGAATMPFGVTAELDTEAGTLTLDEPALR